MTLEEIEHQFHVLRRRAPAICILFSIAVRIPAWICCKNYEFRMRADAETRKIWFDFKASAEVERRINLVRGFGDFVLHSPEPVIYRLQIGTVLDSLQSFDELTEQRVHIGPLNDGWETGNHDGYIEPVFRSF